MSERNGVSKRLLEVMKKVGHILEPCQRWDATTSVMARNASVVEWMLK